MAETFKGLNIAKAGERFGLSAEDLMSLFEDSENEGAQGESFDLPLTKRTTTQTEKGRGGVMGFRKGSQPTRTITETLGRDGVPTIQNIIRQQVNQQQQPAPAPAPEPQKPAAPDLRKLTGAPQEAGAFGSAAVRRAKTELGLSGQQIRDLAQQQGLKLNVLAERELTGQPGPDLWSLVPQGGGPNMEMGVFGGDAVRRARQQFGLSNIEIESLAQAQGLRFNEPAFAELGRRTSAPAAPTPPPAPSANLWSLVPQGGGPNMEMGVFGGLAVRRARDEMKLSNQQIRSLAGQQGLRFNQQALDELMR